MSRDDVEFLDGDAAPGEAEELAAPEPRVSSRVRVLLAAGAALLLLAGLAVRIGTSGAGPGLRAALPSSVPVTSVPVTAPAPNAPADAPERAPAGARGGITDCPYGSRCEADSTVPAPVLAAVRALFPGARPTSVYTLRSVRPGRPAPALESREVTARAGDVAIVIQIRRAQDADEVGSAVVATDPSTVLATRQVRGYFVSVQESTPPNREITTKAVTALAGDPALLALR